MNMDYRVKEDGPNSVHLVKDSKLEPLGFEPSLEVIQISVCCTTHVMPFLLVAS